MAARSIGPNGPMEGNLCPSLPLWLSLDGRPARLFYRLPIDRWPTHGQSSGQTICHRFASPLAAFLLLGAILIARSLSSLLTFNWYQKNK